MGIGVGGRQKVSIDHLPENIGQSTAILNLREALGVAASSSEMVTTEFENGLVLTLNQHNGGPVRRLARIFRRWRERRLWLDDQTVIANRYDCRWSPTAIHSLQAEQIRALRILLDPHHNPRPLCIDDSLSIQQGSISSLLATFGGSSRFYRLPANYTPGQSSYDNQPPIGPFEGCVPLWRVGVGLGLICLAAGWFVWAARRENGWLALFCWLLFVVGSLIWLTGHHWCDYQQQTENYQPFTHGGNVSQKSVLGVPNGESISDMRAWTWVKENFGATSIFGVLLAVYALVPDQISYFSFWKDVAVSLVHSHWFLTSFLPELPRFCVVITGVVLILWDYSHKANLSAYNLKLTKITSTQLQYNGLDGRFDRGLNMSLSRHAYLLEIFNAARAGKSVRNTGQVRAQLTFKVGDWTGIASPGVWVGEHFGSVGFGPGETRELILALRNPHSGFWLIGFNRRGNSGEAVSTTFDQIIPAIGNGVLSLDLISCESGRVIARAQIEWEAPQDPHDIARFTAYRQLA
jgi:hypothetical protein